jgi:hypothetical protein
MPRKDAATYTVALVMELELEHGPADLVAEKLRRVVAEGLHDRCYSVMQDGEENRFSRVRVKRVGRVDVQEQPRLL